MPIEPDQRDKYLQNEAEKLRVGDRIEIRKRADPYTIEDDGEPPTPVTYRWEMVEVVAILPRAPAGNVMIEVRHADGRTSIQPMIRVWRRLSH